MNHDLIQNLKYSYAGQQEAHQIPSPLKASLQLISDFFKINLTNKLCLVFPAKAYSAHWLAFSIVLDNISNLFSDGENKEHYLHYIKGDKLLLNTKAIVEWVGIANNGVTFKTKSLGTSSGAEITIKFEDIVKLKKIETTRNLSSLAIVKNVLPKRILSSPDKLVTPLDKLLKAVTSDKIKKLKHKICLVTKYKDLDDAFHNLLINKNDPFHFFNIEKIGDNGKVDTYFCPLIKSKNLSNLSQYCAKNKVDKIIIDGFSAISDRGTDFSDIDVKNIPTILITDLSEIESFETIGNYGFDFFNFTKENLILDNSTISSPFHSFENRLRKYISFKVVKEICHDAEIEETTKKINSIEMDESNNDLTSLKISLIQLTNLVSRIAYIPTRGEILTLNSKINNIESLFLGCRMWLGDSHKPINESISLLKAVIARLATHPSEKCTRLKTLMSSMQYDYIICSTEEEAKALDDSFPHIRKPRIISAADVNNKLLTSNPQKAILTGWVKSKNINRILSSFVFSELTVLFYQFESKYYNSLQRRNELFIANIKPTINSKGIRSETDSLKQKGFSDLYSGDEGSEATSESSFDILNFELKLDNAQYSRYAAKGNPIDSIKARRIVFERDLFIYSTESHKFLVINELIERKGEKANLHRKKVESLQTGDVIALINTDKDILVELVEKNTNTKELAAVKQWTELWKNLLKEYYASIGSDFKKLVEDLRKNDCMKHEVTIRTWLQDESRIGPDDDADLISIALLTNSNLLNDNIKTVREAIKKMTGWRMKASDFITDKIKAQIHEFADSSIINKKISVEGLGSVIVLKVIEVSNVWENIDVRYVNRLLQREII